MTFKIPPMKVSRSTIFIGAVVGLVVATLIGAVAMRSGRYAVYRNADDGFEIALPAAWMHRQLTLQDGRKIDVFASPNAAVDQASCSVGSSDDDIWSDKNQAGINQAIAGGVLDEKVHALVDAGGGATLVSSKHVSQNGLTAVLAVFSQTVAVDGQSANMRTKVFVTGSPGRVRYIHCVAFESKFGEVDPKFDELIASYRLL